MSTRRDFLKTALGATAVSFLAPNIIFGKDIMGANDRINLGVIGVNSRGLTLAKNYGVRSDCKIAAICDVDTRALEKANKQLNDKLGYVPKNYRDLREMLENKDIDAVAVATPDHWHAPACLLALKAGKHVYLEKPASYAPAEGEMLVRAAAKYNRAVQMGSQRRSMPKVIQGIRELKDGIIGDVSYAKAWYTNTRKSIGHGKVAPVPEWLDWDLWQGPAPRTEFRDNIVHYNWHWFWHWGTGEALNNGTHMVDVCRWGLGEEFPSFVSSTGNRFTWDDDWETPDTQLINIQFPSGKMLSWEGRSCNGAHSTKDPVGAIFYGTNGTLEFSEYNSYKVYDIKGNLVKEVKSDAQTDSRDISNPSGSLDNYHFTNFFDAIREGKKLNQDIDSGHKSTLLVQLGNIAYRTGTSLQIDPSNGHILKNKAANKLWSRTYEKGWEMKLD